VEFLVVEIPLAIRRTANAWVPTTTTQYTAGIMTGIQVEGQRQHKGVGRVYGTE
jgi:hypothetical protein